MGKIKDKYIPFYEQKELDTIVGNTDPVNKPKHYTTGNIEVIDFIEDQKLEYHLGNVIKYICRCEHKGNKLQDLNKAKWYLNRYIDKLMESEDD